jgi:Fe2+ transport system protein FeoA
LRQTVLSGMMSAMKVENDSHFHLVEMNPVVRPLSTVPLNRSVRIERLDGPQQDCARLLDLGFTPGESIAVTHAAPLGDPLVIRVRGALLALRKREAAWIWVE